MEELSHFHWRHFLPARHGWILHPLARGDKPSLANGGLQASDK
jgi:hypothetical protein